jgi:hypothetical protein
MSPRDIARFWSHVEVRGPEDCWPWTGGCTNGYGRFSFGGRAGRTLTASRVAWEITNGRALGPNEARHTCDNPPCVNPAHLIPGSHAQNMADMAERERSPRRKLTGSQVADIRRRRANGAPVVALAAEFAVTPSNVSQIVTGRTWKHLELAS